MIDEELISMVGLLSDSDKEVRDAVFEKMLGRGPEVITDLKALRSRSGRHRHLITRELSSIEREMTWREIVREAKPDIPSLDDVFFLISKLVDSSLEYAEWCTETNDMVCKSLSEINEKKTAVEQVEIFNHIFFHRLHFRMDEFSKEVLLPSVLKSRTGHPIAILLLYFMLARGAGIEICPMCVRRGMVPVMIEKGNVLFFIDLNRFGRPVNDTAFLYSLLRRDADEKCIMDLPGDRILPYVYAQCLRQFHSEPYLDKVMELFKD